MSLAIGCKSIHVWLLYPYSQTVIGMIFVICNVALCNERDKSVISQEFDTNSQPQHHMY